MTEPAISVAETKRSTSAVLPYAKHETIAPGRASRAVTTAAPSANPPAAGTSAKARPARARGHRPARPPVEHSCSLRSRAVGRRASLVGRRHGAAERLDELELGLHHRSQAAHPLTDPVWLGEAVRQPQR